MRIPDWIVFILILAVVVWALFSGDKDADAPEAPPILQDMSGPILPGPTQFDDEVLVQVGETSDGVGTAFAMDRRGVWLTARHVVDGCADVGLQVANGRLLPVTRVVTDTHADIAILYTLRAPRALDVAHRNDLHVGEAGFHVGYPQGRPGEATSRLLARSRLITRGRYRNEENVLAWAEMGRTRDIRGSLAGISGGPVFDQYGGIVGVTVAESPRRGRIYTTAPESLDSVIASIGLNDTGNAVRYPFDIGNYGAQADVLRSELAVVKVYCRADKGT